MPRLFLSMAANKNAHTAVHIWPELNVFALQHALRKITEGFCLGIGKHIPIIFGMRVKMPSYSRIKAVLRLDLENFAT
jgi:hypothetical protein